MYLKKLLTDDSFDHEYYPYNVLIDLGYPQIDFGKITILYGSNGSGKSTLLNLLAKKIDCQRYSSYVENELWVSESSGAPFYLYTNRAVKPIEEASNFINIQFSKEDYLSKKIIVMDDILKSISDEKEYNHHLVNKANSMQEECRQLRKTRYRDVLEGSRIDASRLSDWVSANSKRTSLKRYVEKRIDDSMKVESNGETVLKFYEKNLEYKSIYLLDEPENCLSVIFQIKLIQMIEYAAKMKDCQFIIATHSPIFLSLEDAVVYNLDSVPISTYNWYELENVVAYYNFFKMHEYKFQEGNNEFLNDDQYDYIRMYFSYHNSDSEFRRLNSDEFLIKKAYMLHKKNHRLTPKEIVDLALGIKE